MQSTARVLVVGAETAPLTPEDPLWQELRARPVFVPEAAKAISYLRGNRPDLVIVDLATRDGEAWRLIETLGQEHRPTTTVVLGAGDDPQEAVRAIQLRATKYVSNPRGNADAIRQSITAALGELPAARRVGPVPSADSLDHIVAESSAMRNVMITVERVANSDANILLLGESGSGKEVVARALHQQSSRNRHDFVPVNCAMLSGEMLENELFGHERGAFTSANERKHGLLEIANGGTLFLDEINEMGVSAQARLLRVLERRAFRRVGGTKKLKVDLRVIAASNVDLETEVEMHRFREDLYYRLKVVTITVPPLRVRRADIPPLARHFLSEAPFGKSQGISFTRRAMSRLVNYRWPGNVRELKNVIESIVLMTNKERIDLADLPANIRAATPPPELTIHVGMTMDEIEREVLQHYLEAYPTKQAAARALAMGLRTLHAKVRRYGLPTRRHTH